LFTATTFLNRLNRSFISMNAIELVSLAERGR
jgi:hypothetical protein